MKSRLARSLKFALLFPLILAIAACVRSIQNYPSLVNQGILSLSTTNPYLGSNQFIAREAEASSFLFNFLRSKGAPTAISIEQGEFSGPTLAMFYPKDREVYVAEPQYRNNSRQWVTRGPYAIAREDWRTIGRMETALIGEPVFVVYGKPYRFKFQAPSQTARVLSPEIPIPPTPTPRPKHTSIPKPKGPPGPGDRDFRPMNSDQQAINVSKGFAERALNGDILHTVRNASENLDTITRWYTGSAKNLTKVAEANTLPEKSDLTLGAKIIVPLDLVKNFNAMPSGFH